MLGVVFTEFVDMVEHTFSADMVDDILDDCDLSSGGAYTAVGSYNHSEIVALVVALSKRADMPVDDLIFAFGKHLLTRFAALYPAFFAAETDPFDFLISIENHIHKEVLKLYPNAELPSVKAKRVDPSTLVLTYVSKRPFSTLARGLITGTFEHYGVDCDLSFEDLSTDDENRVVFTIKLV